MKRPLLRVLLHVMAPLLLGVVGYLAWRIADIELFRWIDGWSLGGKVHHAIRLAGKRSEAFVPRMVIDTFPDFLWAYALASALGLAWGDRRDRARVVWLAAGLLAATCLEAAQAAAVLEGMFDGDDLLAMLLGYGLSVLLVSHAALRSPPPPAAS